MMAHLSQESNILLKVIFIFVGFPYIHFFWFVNLFIYLLSISYLLDMAFVVYKQLELETLLFSCVYAHTHICMYVYITYIKLIVGWLLG